VGMFDTFVAEMDIQMKCFYTPISSDGKVWHSGGLCRDFFTGDELPLMTEYYCYPDAFCLLTDDLPYKYILVQDKMFHSFLKEEDEIPENIGDFYNQYGTKIKIEHKNGLIQFYNEENLLDSKTCDDWFVKPSFENELGECFFCLTQKMRMFELKLHPNLVSVEKEIAALKEKLLAYKAKDLSRFNQYLKDENLRLWSLFNL
jgi:hypothetical protein